MPQPSAAAPAESRPQRIEAIMQQLRPRDAVARWWASMHCWRSSAGAAADGCGRG